MDLTENNVCDSKEIIGIEKCLIHHINVIWYYINVTAMLNCDRIKIKLVCTMETIHPK